MIYVLNFNIQVEH